MIFDFNYLFIFVFFFTENASAANDGDLSLFGSPNRTPGRTEGRWGWFDICRHEIWLLVDS